MARYFTRRCLWMHATLIVLLPAFAWLTWWQLSRALAGNTLSWAYTFEWPLFAIYAVYLWWQLIHSSPDARAEAGRTASVEAQSKAFGKARGAPVAAEDLPPGWALTGGRERSVAVAAASAFDPKKGGRGERYKEQTPEEAAALERYNRYLASLAEADRKK